MSTQTNSRARVAFGDFELDCRTLELRRGQIVRLQPQPARILSILVSRPGEVVGREELAEQVWGSDTYVDFEHGLNFAIRKIRSVLKDDAENPRYLETIPKRGYRFIARVMDATALVESPPQLLPTVETLGRRVASSKTLYLAAAGALLVIIGLGRYLRLPWFGRAGTRQVRSLAVLPLRNLSADPEQEYFSDGMTDELITDLAKSQGLRVISHTSVDRYKGTKLALSQIARELGGVDAIVEGTVVRAGDHVRITAQLIDGHSDQHLWADSYDRSLRDVLSTEDEVARSIAEKIETKLSPEQKAYLAATHPVSPEAHDAYLKDVFSGTRGLSLT